MFNLHSAKAGPGKGTARIIESAHAERAGRNVRGKALAILFTMVDSNAEGTN
jgi:hypothetical protein